MKLVSYNIQACIGSRHYSDYLLGLRKQVMHSPAKDRTLRRIARYICDFDIVCLQELDLGGRRNGFASQFEALKKAAGFVHGVAQTTRIVPRISHHGNAVLSRFPITDIEQHALPGRMKGRGLLVCRTGDLTIANTHLSLNAKAQKLQLEAIAIILKRYENAVLVGDFNCRASRPWLQDFCDQTGMRLITGSQTPTFPSWKPRMDIDHVLLGRGVAAAKPEVGSVRLSDHLPVTTRIG